MNQNDGFAFALDVVGNLYSVGVERLSGRQVAGHCASSKRKTDYHDDGLRKTETWHGGLNCSRGACPSRIPLAATLGFSFLSRAKQQKVRFMENRALAVSASRSDNFGYKGVPIAGATWTALQSH